MWFAAGAVFLALLSVELPLAGIYPMVFLTGCSVVSAQVLVHASTSADHPPQVRATALAQPLRHRLTPQRERLNRLSH